MYSEWPQTGLIKFTAAGDVLPDQSRTFNVLSVTYYDATGNGGYFDLMDGAGHQVDEAQVPSSRPDITHPLYGEEIKGFRVAAIPSGGVILIHYRRRTKAA